MDSESPIVKIYHPEKVLYFKAIFNFVFFCMSLIPFISTIQFINEHHDYYEITIYFFILGSVMPLAFGHMILRSILRRIILYKNHIRIIFGIHMIKIKYTEIKEMDIKIYRFKIEARGAREEYESIMLHFDNHLFFKKTPIFIEIYNSHDIEEILDYIFKMNPKIHCSNLMEEYLKQLKVHHK